MSSIRYMLAITLLAAAGVAHADSIWDQMGSADVTGEDATPKQGFAGNFSFGYLASTGNAPNSNLNTKLGLGYTKGRWQHGAVFEVIRATENGATTAERYDAAFQSDYQLNQKSYLFGYASYENDKFSGYNRRTTEAVGYGRHILKTKTQTLDLEAGVGARQANLIDGTDQHNGIIRLGGDYAWQFSDSGSLSQSLALEKGADNTYTESVTAVKASLIGSLALSVSYTVKHNSSVPVGTVNTDTYTTVSIEYSF